MELNLKRFSELDAVKFVNKIETKFPVDEWKIDDIEIWPLIRPKIVVYLVSDKTICNNGKLIKLKKYFNLLKEFYIYFKLTLKDKKHNIGNSKNFDILISSSNIDRTIQLDNKLLYDTNCDPFYDTFKNRFNLKVLILEKFSIDKQNLPRYSRSKFFNMIIIKSLILSKLNFFKRHNLRLSKYDEFKNYLKNFGIPEYIVNEETIKKNVVFYEVLSKYLMKKLKNNNVKLVLMICYYSAQNFALSLACNKLNIPCVDIQHGCAGNSCHRMYYSWMNIPINGYKLMPKGFWCWDKEDARAINEWQYKKAKSYVICGGRLIRKNWIDRKDILYNYYLRKISQYIEIAKEKNLKIILVTLQPGVAYNKWFEDIIRQETGYLWIIREHFTSDTCQTNFMNSLKQYNNIILTRSKDFPLEFLLIILDIHITYSSSVIIDAEYFSKQSIMLDRLACNRYKKYFDLGCLEYAKDADELLIKIEKLISRKYIRKQDDENMYDKGIDKLMKLIKKSENDEQQTKIH